MINLTDISIYVAQCTYGYSDERETEVVYAGISLIDAVEAVKEFKPAYNEEKRFAYVTEWVSGEFVQQMEVDL